MTALRRRDEPGTVRFEPACSPQRDSTRVGAPVSEPRLLGADSGRRFAPCPRRRRQPGESPEGASCRL